MANLSAISTETLLGRVLRAPLRLIPRTAVSLRLADMTYQLVFDVHVALLLSCVCNVKWKAITCLEPNVILEPSDMALQPPEIV